MKVLKRLLVGVAAAAALSIAGAAQGSTLNWATSGSGPTGSVKAFSMLGSSIADAVLDAHNGVGVFEFTNFKSDMANVFIVDLGGDAGLTLIALWGNSGTTANTFTAFTTITPSLGEGAYDGDPDGINAAGNPVASAGVSQGFAFGGAAYNTSMGNDFVIDSGTPLPTGFAISNIQNFNSLSSNSIGLDWISMLGAIQQWGLFSDDGIGNPILTGTGTGGGGENTLILAIPLPAPVWMGLAGLAGVIVLRRRIV